MSDEQQKEPTTDDELDEDFSASDNPMAIVGFVLAFLFSPLGLIFSIIGFNQAAEVGDQGRGLSIAGIIISSLSVAWLLAFLLISLTAVDGLLPYQEPIGQPTWVRKQFNADKTNQAVLLTSGDTSKIKTTSGQFRYRPAQPETCRYWLADYPFSRPESNDIEHWPRYSDYLVTSNPESVDIELPTGISVPLGLGSGPFVLADSCGDWQLVDDLLPAGG